MNNDLKAVRKEIGFPSLGSSPKHNLRQECGCRQFISRVIPGSRGGLYMGKEKEAK